MKPNPGTDQRDNHRTGNLTAPIVSAFRSDTETLFADGFESGDTRAWLRRRADAPGREPPVESIPSRVKWGEFVSGLYW